MRFGRQFQTDARGEITGSCRIRGPWRSTRWRTGSLSRSGRTRSVSKHLVCRAAADPRSVAPLRQAGDSRRQKHPTATIEHSRRWRRFGAGQFPRRARSGHASVIGFAVLTTVLSLHPRRVSASWRCRSDRVSRKLRSAKPCGTQRAEHPSTDLGEGFRSNRHWRHVRTGCRGAFRTRARSTTVRGEMAIPCHWPQRPSCTRDCGAPNLLLPALRAARPIS